MVQLSSVPYAMKSADAQALAGHPAGDFVTQEQLSQFAQTEAERASAQAFSPLLSGTITGSGTTGTIPQFTGTNTIGNSDIYQVGTSIGINETAPADTLDVNGTAQFRGTLTLPPLATATSTKPQASQLAQWSSSTWSSTAAAAVNPTYKLSVSAIGNNTATPSGDLLFNYQLGTGPSSTILYVTPTGALTSYGGYQTTPTSLATSSAAVNSPLVELSGSVYHSSTSSAAAQNFAWQVIPTGNDTTTPSANIALLWSSGTTTPVATGFSISSKGRITWATGQTFPITGTGGGTITGITTSSPLTGSGTSGSVALGLNESTLVNDISPSLESDFNSVYAQLGAGNTFTAPQQVNASGADTSGVDAVVTGNGSIGIYGESDGAINGSATPVGVEGLATSTDGNGMMAVETGPNGYGIYAHASGTHSSTSRSTPVGVYALSENGNGVLGIATGGSGRYNAYNAAGYTGGAWGDTSAPGSSQSLAGIVGSADDNDAGYFVNDSADSTTIFATNESSGGTGLFTVFKASTRAGTCGIGDGNLTCTGQVKTLSTTGGGAHTVETYATQSAENWMEDYGTGTMKMGVAVVKIDPAFAETVSETADYHVFLTPNADSKGLYVINKTLTSFEVRESGGGTSSLTFDYKIVGKRRGYEAQRLVDVTDRFNQEQARSLIARAHGAVIPAAGSRRTLIAH